MYMYQQWFFSVFKKGPVAFEFEKNHWSVGQMGKDSINYCIQYMDKIYSKSN